VKSTDAGATFSTGVSAATTTGYFAGSRNTALSLGPERTSSDLAIAVDPNNASHVVVVYGDANEATPADGILQLHVIESTDGGATWTLKYTTPQNVRSSLPAVSITDNGTIGLLYAQYDPATDQLSQYLLTTSDDFATTDNSLLGSESAAVPSFNIQPFIGDFYDMTSVGDTLYGVFSANNDDNGDASTGAMFPDASYQRAYLGTPGQSDFELVNGSAQNPFNPNNQTAFSIDPYFFAFDAGELAAPVPEPASLMLFATALGGLAGTARRRRSGGGGRPT
jgi:hypothetical protein